MLPSGPRQIPCASAFAVGIWYSTMAPAGVMRPMAFEPPVSANHRLPSGPATIAPGLPPDGTGNSVMVPVGVMRPILRPSFSVNQTLPSGPLTIPHGLLAIVGMAHSVNMPAGVTRPILLPVPFCSVNHRLPSGPVVIPYGPPLVVGTAYSVNIPPGVLLATRLPIGSVNQRLPSGPAVIPAESRPPGTPRSVIWPPGEAKPTPCCFAYQPWPSGPVAIPTGPMLVIAATY